MIEIYILIEKFVYSVNYHKAEIITKMKTLLYHHRGQENKTLVTETAAPGPP